MPQKNTQNFDIWEVFSPCVELPFNLGLFQPTKYEVHEALVPRRSLAVRTQTAPGS
jgi:hypothetical protein